MHEGREGQSVGRRLAIRPPTSSPVAEATACVPDLPLGSTRGRDWKGHTADYYGASDYDHVSTSQPDHHVVCVILAGTARLTQWRKGQTHTAAFPPGSVIIIPAGTETRSHGRTAPSLRIWIPPSSLAATGEQLDMRGNDAGALVDVFCAMDRALERYAALLHHEIMSPEHSTQSLIVESLSNAVSAHLLRSYGAGRPAPSDRLPTLDAGAVASVSTFIDQHLGESIRLDQLAEITGVSRFHFSRSFKDATGSSPMAFVEQARIRQAIDLIRGGKMSLAEIAAAVGFSDQSHFTRRFVRQIGLTPAVYARQVRTTISIPRAPRRTQNSQ